MPVVLRTWCCVHHTHFLHLFQVYLKEAPWPSAQSEVRTINAYKTPRDKVQCILRMCSTIMNLLSLANEDSVPGADDFVPVLVFVLIKVSHQMNINFVQECTYAAISKCHILAHQQRNASFS